MTVIPFLAPVSFFHQTQTGLFRWQEHETPPHHLGLVSLIKYVRLIVVSFFSHLRRNPVFTYSPLADCDLGYAMPDRRKVEETKHRLSFDRRQSKSRSRRAEGNGKVEVFCWLADMRWIPRPTEFGFDHEMTCHRREEEDEKEEGKENRLRCDTVPPIGRSRLSWRWRWNNAREAKEAEVWWSTLGSQVRSRPPLAFDEEEGRLRCDKRSLQLPSCLFFELGSTTSAVSRRWVEAEVQRRVNRLVMYRRQVMISSHLNEMGIDYAAT